MRNRCTTAILLIAAAFSAAPAVADVKAGVDSWGRGDYKKAVEQWRPAAVAGDPDAQFDLAQAYKLGRGVPVDLALAEQWYGRAAAQGHVQASDNYGLTLFQNGKHAEAVPWLEKSVARGEPRAQLVLGTMLFNGDSVRKDWVRAYALLTRSAASGLPQASQTMAQMDQYISADVRQQGLALAKQYERAQSTAGAPQELAGTNYDGPVRATDLPASSAAEGSYSTPVTGKPTRSAAPPAMATTPPASPPPPARTIAGKGWRFQVGAFRDEGNAHRLWQQIQSRVGAAASLQPFFMRNGPLTNLQIGPLATRADALKVCGDVKARLPGTPCVPIAP
jgi:TPR repeat protein